MPLTVGTRLGPYEILAPIGAGGMGEVYRARDTRLGREVAIKALPSAEPERLHRFEQEARAASALNHPNILTVYDTGCEGGVHFIAAELVDGEPLRLKPDRTIRALLDLAVQTADGLAAAHAAGIVHRDLKPDNVMVRRDGRVKILDFGLAKTITHAAAAGDETRSLTVTGPGTILGTVAYMSPEQARGVGDLDFRSDQFSFGLILYELASGRRAFTRNSGPETLVAIIREEPAPLPASVPAPLRWLIERCLAKEPTERYNDTRDLYLELRHLRDHISEAATTRSAARAEEAAMTPRPLAWVTAAVFAMVLVMAGYFGYGHLAHTPEPPKFTRLTFRQGILGNGRFASDGRSVLFAAIWEGSAKHHYAMSADSLDARDLNLPENVDVVAVSSKGELAILLGESSNLGCVLARRPVSGGTPREALEHVMSADWSPDGESLAVIRKDGSKWRVEYPAGTVLYETTDTVPSALRVSPDGGAVAFIEFATGRSFLKVIMRSGSVKLTAPVGEYPVAVWSAGGRELWFTQGSHSETTLLAINLSGRKRIPGWGKLYDISRDGRALLSVSHDYLGVF